MDGVSLAVGIVALAGLFNNAVEDFEYIQLGRDFGRDFQTSLLTLDAARLQLTRWGQSVGLGSNTEAATNLQGIMVAKKDITLAEAILGQIGNIFQQAKTTADSYLILTPDGHDTLSLHNSDTDLDATAQTLHRKMRNLCISRQKQVGIRKKTKWALYEKKRFASLIDDLDRLVHRLVELFPVVKPVQQKLCESEVKELSEDNGLPLLKEVALDHDTLLKSAITTVLGNAGVQHHSNTAIFSGDFNQGIQIGQSYGSVSYGGSANK